MKSKLYYCCGVVCGSLRMGARFMVATIFLYQRDLQDQVLNFCLYLMSDYRENQDNHKNTCTLTRLGLFEANSVYCIEVL